MGTGAAVEGNPRKVMDSTPPISMDSGRGTRSPGEILLRWLLRGSAAAFVISVLLHALGLALSGYVRVGGVGGGGLAGAPEDLIEMAIVTDVELAEAGSASVDLAAPAVPDLMVDTDQSSDLLDGMPSDNPGGSIADLGGLDGAGGSGDISDLSGEGFGGSGGGGGASFFGIEASGNRFAYIVDVSGSMEGPRLEALRREITNSVGELLETSEFVVIPFASSSEALGKRKAWTEASPTGKTWARNTIAAELAVPRDGTIPLPAFQIVYGLRPKPDAIYFMTDGEQFPEGTLEEIGILNRQLKVPIHCIRFGDEGAKQSGPESAESIMKQIARQSRGTYKFIAIR